MSNITLDLPEQTLNQARQAAQALQRPLEDVLRDMLTAVLPPLDDVPPNLQHELMEMTWLSNDELWQIARAEMSATEQHTLQQLSQLSEPNQEQALELEGLRHAYGRVTLRKARAYALLSLRSGQSLLS